MALTREQFQKLRDKGLSVEQIVAFDRGETPIDLQKQKQLQQEVAGNQFEQKKPTTFLGKAKDFVTDIIGGRKLAEGIAGVRAAPEIIGDISNEQRQTEELQQRVLTRIKEMESLGKDTSRLEKTLKMTQDLAISLQDTQKDFEEALPTSKEVIGSTARLATTLGTGLITRTAAKGLALGKAVGLTQGALRGAGVGAISGGVVGGLQGAGLAAEAEKSSEEILSSGLLGVGVGALVGGAIGTISGGVSGTLKQRAITKENFATELSTPKQTPTERANAIQQGRLKDPTLFGKAELEFSKRDKIVGDSIKDIVKPKATIGQNIDAIRLKISQINSGVKDFIAKNKVPFNTNQLKSQLETGKEDLRLIFASDASAEKTYNAVANAFMENVGKKDTAGLFSARQTFDKIPAIRKLLESDKLGENARKEIVLAVRRAANEYIASLLPKGNQYRAQLMQESYMLEALGNLSEKSQSIIGKNKLQLLTAQYPILKWVVGGIATGLAGAAGIGVGGAIIGSSE